jgi:hypothetical protein
MKAWIFGSMAGVMILLSVGVLTRMTLRAEPKEERGEREASESGPRPFIVPGREATLSELLTKLKELRSEEKELIQKIKTTLDKEKKSLAAKEKELEETKQALEKIERELKDRDSSVEPERSSGQTLADPADHRGR